MGLFVKAQLQLHVVHIWCGQNQGSFTGVMCLIKGQGRHEGQHHFFLHCPAYALEGQLLTNLCRQLSIEVNSQNFLFGLKTFSTPKNYQLLQGVVDFIKNSKRF